MPVVSADYISGDKASHLVAPRTWGRMAAVYALDIGSGVGSICSPLPECMAPGVVKEPSGLFDDFFVVCYFRSGFAGGGHAVGDRMFNRRPDASDGRKLASRW